MNTKHQFNFLLNTGTYGVALNPLLSRIPELLSFSKALLQILFVLHSSKFIIAHLAKVVINCRKQISKGPEVDYSGEASNPSIYYYDTKAEDVGYKFIKGYWRGKEELQISTTYLERGQLVFFNYSPYKFRSSPDNTIGQFQSCSFNPLTVYVKSKAT